jgi:hypothetical protein
MIEKTVFCNDDYVEELSRGGRLVMPITTIFIGSYGLAVEILLKITNYFPQDEAVATKLWRVQFDDSQTKTDFLALCSDAICVDGWFLVMDCVIREWLVEHGGIVLEEIVAIEFSSLRLRAAFIAETDH